MFFFLFGPLPPYMDVIYYRRIFFSSTGRQAAAGDLELHDRFCDEAWKNDPGRTNNFLEKKKLFENCFLSMVSAPICIYRNLFTSIHYKDTGELFGFTVYSIGNENSFCFKKRVFLSLFYWKITLREKTDLPPRQRSEERSDGWNASRHLEQMTWRLTRYDR